ncbi:MAG: DUF3768 domain-containing protein [Thalassovita sp.]
MPDLMKLTPDQVERQLEINAIAQQNDVFRSMPNWGEKVGKWVLTQGVQSKGCDFVRKTVEAVMAFDDFTEDMDPYGTHEMGKVEIEGETVWWKIDLYDTNYEFGSPSPAALIHTRRVLTLHFPCEN